MKYIIVLADGMADYKIPELNGKTPLEAAVSPNMDYIARHGVAGLLKTIPDGMPPGSDTANLSVMGFDPEKYYSGRSPLEAVSMGIELAPEDVTYRCNLVTLSDTADYQDAAMLDYSSGEITTEESRKLVEALQEVVNDDRRQLYPGISYRHCLVLRNREDGTDLTPPHDISGKVVGEYLPKNGNAEELFSIMQRSREVLKSHPVNLDRIRRGKNPATSAWFWGEGRKPALPSFKEKFGLKGAVISAVDLIKGIAICAGLESIDVPGATGNIDTNFDGKAQAAIKALETNDFVYIHIEAPDECGHHGDINCKVRSIELIDEKIIGPILRAMKGQDFTLAVLPDHPTPISTRTHARDAVPFAYMRSNDPHVGLSTFNEATAQSTGLYIPQGCQFIETLIHG